MVVHFGFGLQNDRTLLVFRLGFKGSMDNLLEMPTANLILTVKRFALALAESFQLNVLPSRRQPPCCPEGNQCQTHNRLPGIPGPGFPHSTWRKDFPLRSSTQCR